MEELQISMKKTIKTVCEADVITPDSLVNKTTDEIYSERVYVGRNLLKLKEVFDIEGTTAKNVANQKIILTGNFSKVKRIGQKMSAGEIIINGDVGMHLGERIKGGKITVNGNVDSFVCCNATGGSLVVNGDVKHHLASSYRGNRSGSSNINVEINGNVGHEAAKWFCGNKIIIRGEVGSFLGCHMQSGSIIIDGKTKGRIAPFMKEGKILVLQKTILMPGFEFIEKIHDVTINGNKYQGTFNKYIGDLTENGKGTVFIKQ